MSGPQKGDNCYARRALQRDDALPATHRRAYSLIEMLVVVTLIAILVSVLIPSLRRSLQIAATTVCMNNLRSVGSALEMYRMDNGGWLPNVNAGPNQVSSGEESNETVWFMMLSPEYLDDQLALSCPEDPLRFKQSDIGASGTDSVVTASYGINGFTASFNGGYLANLDRRIPSRPLDTILAADVGPDNVGSSSSSEPGEEGDSFSPRESGILTWNDGYDPLDADVFEPWLTTRHGNSINMLTVGGAIREVRTDDIMRKPIEPFYSDCAAGGCTLCNELQTPHYSFARDRLYWWTGLLPQE